jgi:hypothetical protein
MRDTKVVQQFMSESPDARRNLSLPDIIYLPDQRQATKPVTSGSDRRQRTHIERFRTDDTEHEVLAEKVHASGMSFGAYMRHLALGTEASRPRRASPEAKALTAGIVAFNRAHSNLNEIVQAANALAGRQAERTELTAAIRDLCRQVENLRHDFTEPVQAILAALHDVR